MRLETPAGSRPFQGLLKPPAKPEALTFGFQNPAHRRRKQRSVPKPERTFAFESLHSFVGLLKSRLRDDVRVLLVILLADQPVPNLA